MKTVVITGPTGAVGTALIRALLKRDCEIYAVLHPGSRRVKNLPVSERVHVLACNITELNTLPEQIEHADMFYHFAWQGTTGAARNDMPLQNTNIRCAIEAAETASALGCGCFIGAGSQAEYGRVEGLLRPDTPCFPENGYGMAKLCAGQMTRKVCDRYGMTHIWMRILSVYGPHDGANTLVMSVLRALLAGETPGCTEGAQIWDYLYSEDAARALYLAASRCERSTVYCLGSGEARPLRDYITDMRDTAAPEGDVAFGARPYAPGQVMYLTADLTALTRDTGFVPQVPFREGVRRTLAWIREGEARSDG